MTNLVGTTLGQYQIVELVGEGGMANVYKAWQPSLRRYVALKVLAPHLSNDAEFLKRFQQEAVSAANLKHTNIVTIHDVGEENGHHYIAMEFIEGDSLADRVRPGQAMAPEQVVDVISQVGSALDYAHQRGFIHRDIKPANVLIDPGGRAVLTDFGIAKAVSGSGVTGPLTKVGSIFGTPHYMSPEQVREQELDHRSDLYSLGVVCYEMLSGEAPFDGTTTHAVLYAQANNPPPPLREVNPAVPGPVEAVVSRMLNKERDRRYPSAGAFAMALAQAVAGVWPEEAGEETVVGGRVPTGTEVIDTVIGAGPAPSRTPSPARSAGGRRRWPLILGALAVGIVLIVGALLALVVLPGLGNATEKRLSEAQTALAEGRYAAAAEQYQDVLGEEPDNAEALEGLLEVAQAQAQAEAHDPAIATFKQVLEQDPDNVEALQGIGEAYEAQEQWQQAADWYEKWTQVVPDDAEARLALGWVYYELENFEQAVAEFERVTSLQPDSISGWQGLAQSLYNVEQCEKAVESLKRWNQLEPDEPVSRRLIGRCYLQLEQFDEAIAEFEKLTEIAPGFPDGFEGLGDAFYRNRDYVDALAAYQQWSQLSPDSAQARGMVGWAALRAEQYSLAIDTFEQAVKMESRAEFYYGLGQAYEANGNRGQALESFQKSLELDPEQSEPYWRIGRIYRLQGRLEDAVDAYEKAVELGTQAVQAFRGLGYTYRDLDEHRKALTAFQKWVEIEPENPDAFNLIGLSHSALAEFPFAIQAFKRAAELEEESSVFFNIGESYRLMGDCTQAVSFYNKALELDPSYENAIDGLAKCQDQ